MNIHGKAEYRFSIILIRHADIQIIFRTNAGSTVLTLLQTFICLWPDDPLHLSKQAEATLQPDNDPLSSVRLQPSKPVDNFAAIPGKCALNIYLDLFIQLLEFIHKCFIILERHYDIFLIPAGQKNDIRRRTEGQGKPVRSVHCSNIFH